MLIIYSQLHKDFHMKKALFLTCIYTLTLTAADLPRINIPEKVRVLFFESDINQPYKSLKVPIKPSTCFQNIADLIKHNKKTDGQLFYRSMIQEMTYSKENFTQYGIQNRTNVPLFTHFNDSLFFLGKPKKTAHAENNQCKKNTTSHV